MDRPTKLLFSGIILAAGVIAVAHVVRYLEMEMVRQEIPELEKQVSELQAKCVNEGEKSQKDESNPWPGTLLSTLMSC